MFRETLLVLFARRLQCVRDHVPAHHAGGVCQQRRAGRLRVFDELNDVRDMAQVDAASFALIKRVIFGTDADPAPGYADRSMMISPDCCSR